MTKAKISEYDAVASNNTDVNGVNIAEGCPPSGMNNMGREIMAALKRFQVGSDGDGVTVGGNLVVSGSSTLSTTSISSADINAGTIDGTAIGGSTPAAGSFTTLNTSGAVVFNDAGADVDFRVEGDTNPNLLFVDASADAVGIGTNAPEGKGLDIQKAVGVTYSATAASVPLLRIENLDAASADNEASIIFRSLSGAGQNADFFISSVSASSGNAPNLTFKSRTGSGTYAERMRIDSSGNLLVGATSGSARLFVQADSSSVTPFIVNSTASGTGATNVVAWRRNGNTTGLVQITGTNTSYLTSSDYRLKENVAPMTGALAKVLELNPVTYTWKADGSAGEGFIAHELQEVAPYAVSGEKDGEEMQGVDYGKITPLLTAALQEAIAEIQSLKARIEALEAK